MPDLLPSVWQEATTAGTAAETIEPDDPKEKHVVAREDPAQEGKQKETPTAEETGELPASTPASVA